MNTADLQAMLDYQKAHKHPIGDVEEGGFHKWLGKDPDEPITDADIEKGLAAGGHAAKMANFAKNARKWHHFKHHK